eukprot:Phypoly_transcript_06757.p1 GENE.Phypoly_transcript_06757~~Phypoly_transcript_06757.p1  ORF type:complete len:524 (+),score=51.75 Phypoly_transcript_06757:127-1698(+)
MAKATSVGRRSRSRSRSPRSSRTSSRRRSPSPSRRSRSSRKRSPSPSPSRSRSPSPRRSRRSSHRKSSRRRHSRSRSSRRRRSRRSSSRSSSRSPKRRSSSSRSRSSSRSSKSRSPTPKKKSRGLWDKAPPGYEGLNVAQLASINPAALMPLITPPNSQQNRQARRIYVGGIPATASEDHIKAFFDNAMSTLLASAGAGMGAGIGSCTGVQVNHEKMFSFVEFRSPEEATTAMGLDGILMDGQFPLKIRRPTDYKPPGSIPINPTLLAAADPAAAIAAAAAVVPVQPIPNVPESPHKLFMGGIPSTLTEEQLKPMLQGFGQLKAFNMIKDTVTGLSKGYAFFEYVDSNVTDAAIQGLHGITIGDKTVLVQRASVGAKKPAATVMPIPHATPLSVAAAAAAAGIPLPQPSAAALVLPSQTIITAPTRVLLLLNMVTEKDLLVDDEFDDIVVDIREECEKFGPIKSVVIPRPKDGIPTNVGKVFLEYERVEDCTKAHATLGGRLFAGKSVIAVYYDEAKFAARVY